MDDYRPISKAPPPITPVRGSYLRPRPEPSQQPSSLPASYPNELNVRSTDEVRRAIKAFPLQSQILDICKRVLSKLIPAFCSEVRAKRLRADLALSHMKDLIHSLLVYNVSTGSEFRLEQELMRSKEWGSLVGRLRRAEIRTARLGSEPNTKEGIWKTIDHSLVSLKLSDAAGEIHEQMEELRRQVRARVAQSRNDAGLGPGLLEVELSHMRRWAESLQRIYLEVWQRQGRAETPLFVRTVWEKAIAPAIDGRLSASRCMFENLAARTRRALSAADQGNSTRQMRILRGELARRVEIRAKELEYALATTRSATKTHISRPKTKLRRPDSLVLEPPSKRASYTQGETARALGCSTRQVRNLVKGFKLTRTARGRIVNDAKLQAEYDSRHGPLKYK